MKPSTSSSVPRRTGAARGGVVAVIAVVAIVATMVLVRRSPPTPAPTAPSTPGVNASSATATPTPGEIVSVVTSIPQSTLDSVGAGSGVGQPIPLPASTPSLKLDGKPEVFSVGAEFCPFCAAQRWALLNALSRFGTFTNVGLTMSAADDVYPSTRTLTFHGSSYTSEYVSFVSLETNTNVRALDGRYGPLEVPTADQMQLFQKFNAPPYIEGAGGSIPFLIIGNKYVVSGSSYRPDVLQRRSWSDITASLSSPTSPTSQQMLGAANVLTAAICKTTGGKPAPVCTSKAVVAAGATLKK